MYCNCYVHFTELGFSSRINDLMKVAMIVIVTYYIMQLNESPYNQNL